MLKTVVFDVGNVVWDTYLLNKKTFSDWANFLGLSFDEFFFRYKQIYKDIERGTKNINDLASHFSTNASDLQMILDSNLADPIRFNKFLISPTLTAINEFRKAGLPVGCLSNTEIFMKPYLEKNISPLFDYTIYSYQVEAIKPEATIYQQIFKYVSCTPSEVLFFDDKDINIEGAQKLGINTFKVNATHVV